MPWILIAIGFLAILVLEVIITLHYALKEPTKSHDIAKKIVYDFTKEDTTDTLTSMVEFHKKHEDLKKYDVN